jgi:AbrB family looped-hinge helix DNA binding protein
MQVRSKITSKGQVTIPKRIREELRLKPKDSILFIKQGNNIVIKPAKTLLDLKGSIKTDKKIQDWEDVRAEAKKTIAKKISKSLK